MCQLRTRRRPRHEQPSLLPAPERVKAEARRSSHRRREARPACRGRPGRAGARRRPAGPPRPALRLRRPRDDERRRAAGVRVKVRFAGQDVDGFVIARSSTTEHTGRLQPLRRVVSPERVLTPDVAALTGAVAARYAGIRSDVLRLAVPPRHATVEKETSEPAATVTAPARPRTSRGIPMVRPCCRVSRPGSRLGRCGRCSPATTGPRCWPKPWWRPLASGRGALSAFPTTATWRVSTPRSTERLGTGRHVVLAADTGPAKRYRAFLAISRGAVRIVIGTRAAMFAPVQDLGLVAIWDDGDDLHDEPRAPYPHAREVLLMRAQETGCAAVLAAHARSVEAEYLLRTGWATRGRGDRGTSYASASRCTSPGTPTRTSSATRAHGRPGCRRGVRAAARRRADGPGARADASRRLRARLACDRCRTPALCGVCHGPLRARGPQRPPECAWCATAAPGWRCAECGGHGLRAPVLGDARTAEELGRALPGVLVRTSSRETACWRRSTSVRRSWLPRPVPSRWPPAGTPRWCCSTPGSCWPARTCARPRRRYADGPTPQHSCDLRPTAAGSCASGTPTDPGLQALVRWDPGGLPPRDRGTAVRPPAAGLPGRHRHRGAGRPRAGARLAAAAARCRGARPRPGRVGAGDARRRVGPLRRTGAARLGCRAVRSARRDAGPPLDPQAPARPRRGGPGRARLDGGTRRTATVTPDRNARDRVSRSCSRRKPSGNSRRPRPCTAG